MSADQLERIIAEGTFRALSSMENWKTGKPSNHLVCTDGFKLSVVAGDGTYCSPRPSDYGFGDVPGTYEGPYTAVEVGFPSARPEPWDQWSEWCENPEDPTATVYNYVPVDAVRALIAHHGGLV